MVVWQEPQRSLDRGEQFRQDLVLRGGAVLGQVAGREHEREPRFDGVQPRCGELHRSPQPVTCARVHVKVTDVREQDRFGRGRHDRRNLAPDKPKIELCSRQPVGRPHEMAVDVEVGASICVRHASHGSVPVQSLSRNPQARGELPVRMV